MEYLQQFWNGLVTWFIDNRGWVEVLKVVLFAVLGLIAVKVALRVIRKANEKEAVLKKSSKLARSFLYNTLRVVLYFLYFIVLLGLLGLELSNLVTIISALGLALSLAMQKVASNFASGMILVANKSFEEGDYISGAGAEGTVVDIAIFSTKLLTPDNKIAVVPNASLADNTVTNFSAKETRRVDLNFSVAYGTEVELVRKTLEEILDAHELVRHDDGYSIRLKEHGESAMKFVCRFWVNRADYWTCYFDVTEQAYKRFGEVGIVIPYNKLDVNLISKQ